MLKNKKFCNKELELLDRLKHENKKLKRQISALRKQLEKIDINKYNNLQELLNKQEREDHQSQDEKRKKALIRTWKCYECEKGILQIVILNRRDGVFYLRRCSNPECRHQTKTQKYHKLVNGIKEF